MNAEPETGIKPGKAGSETLPALPQQVTWWRRAEAFLTGPLDALPLRLFEMAFTLSFLLRLTRNFPLSEWLTEDGFHLTSAEWVRLGYPPSMPLLPLWGAWCWFAATVGGAGCLLFGGTCRRPALGLLFLSAVYAQGVDYLSASSSNKIYIAVYAILTTGPGLWRDPGCGGWKISAAPVRLLQATLLVIYFSAGWAKAFAGDWLKHSDVLFTQVQGIHRTDLAAWALRTLPAWAWTGQQHLALFLNLPHPS